MSGREDLQLHSDRNEGDEACDPMATHHVSKSKPRDLIQLKISRRSSLKQNQSKSPTKISISTIPHDELEDFKGLISGKSLNDDQDGVFMITLAGENLGANMAIRNAAGLLPATPNVNNNVQSINNSALQESSCATRDPGVHLEIISNRKDMDMVNCAQRKEAGLNLNLEQEQEKEKERRSRNEPRVRRRCLRALLMESDSDIEDAGKPRRHGCRYTCQDKRGDRIGGDGGGAGTSGKVH